MPHKRSADDAEILQGPSQQAVTKHARRSTSIEETLSSSDPSATSVYDDVALRSSLSTSAHENESSVSSLDGAEASPESSSEESSNNASSSEDESETGSENEDPIVTIGAPKKPLMQCDPDELAYSHDLQRRVAALLPQIAAANEMLKDGGSHSMEEVEEGTEHIEMNLGLGVLEEKRDTSSSSNDSDSDETDSGDQSQKVGIMDKLLGQDRAAKKTVSIEEVT